MLKKREFFIYFFACILSVFSVFNSSEGYDDNNGALLNRAEKFFSALKNKKWEETYNFRTDLYKKSISKNYYIDSYTQNYKGKNLISFDFIDYKIKDNYAILKVKLIEKSANNFLAFLPASKEEIILLTTWEKIDGIWFCRNAGHRRGFTLNVDMVMKNGQRPVEEEFGLPSYSVDPEKNFKKNQKGHRKR